MDLHLRVAPPRPPRPQRLLRLVLVPLLPALLLLLPLLPGSLPELSGTAAAPARVGSIQAGPGDREYRWPVGGRPHVTRPFDPPAKRWLPGHRGVDLAAPPGAVVRAAGAGVVFFAGPVAGRGVVSVAHRDQLRTTYQPLTPVVSAGDVVAVGDPIGILEAGHAGCPVVACLHWGLRRGEFYLDPLALLGLGRIRLLPVSGSRTTSPP